MKYLELRNRIKENLFTVFDIKKHFYDESEVLLKTQLSRFRAKGLIVKIKRGLYCFDATTVEEFELAGELYKPSYISLESALNYYGGIPDIPQSVTCISLTNTKKISNQFGTFHYNKIKRELFWGYQSRAGIRGGGNFLIADRQKALLDFFYIRKIRSLEDLRLDLGGFDFDIYRKYAKFFPDWVQRIKIN